MYACGVHAHANATLDTSAATAPNRTATAICRRLMPIDAPLSAR